MEITNQLFKPFVEKIEAEWQKLYCELANHESNEARDLRPSVLQKLNILEKIKLSAVYQEESKDSGLEFPNLREALRYLKLDLRFARRRWTRYLVSATRTQKRRENANGVAPVSA